MKKKFFISLLMISSILSVPSIIFFKNSIINKIDNKINNLSFKGNIQTREILDGDFLLSQYNGILPTQNGNIISFTAGEYNSNSLTSGKTGYLINHETNRGVDFIDFNGEKKWDWKDGWSGFRIDDSIYLPSIDKYVIMYHNTSNYQIRCVVLHPERGFFSNSNWYEGFGTQRINMIPILDNNNQQTNEFIIFARKWFDSNSFYYKVTIGDSGSINFQKVSFNQSDSNNTMSTISAGAIKVNNNEYLATVELKSNNDYFLGIYKNGSRVYRKYIGSVSIPQNIDDIFQNLKMVSAEVDIFNNNNYIYINWFNNVTTSNKIQSYSFNSNNQPSESNFYEKIISFQRTGIADFDALNSRVYNGVMYLSGLECLSDGTAKNRILKINSRLSYSNQWDESNFNFNNEINDVFSLFDYSDNLQKRTDGKIYSLPKYDSQNQYNQNIGIFCTDSSSELSHSFQVIGSDGNYQYSTKRKTTGDIFINNVNSNTLTEGVDYSNQLQNSYVNNQLISENFSQYVNNSDYTILSSPLSKEDAIKGRIPARIIFQRGFDGTSTSSKNVSLDVVFTGWKTISTSLIKTDNNILELRYYLPQDIFDNKDRYINTIKDFIANNCFSATPSNFTANNIIDVNIQDYNNRDGTIIVNNITIDKWIDDEGNLQTVRRTFDSDIAIKGFLKASPTELVSTDILNTNILFQNLNTISTNEDSRKDIESKLLEWIKQNYTKVFKNLPNNFSRNNVVKVELDIQSVNVENMSASFNVYINNYFSQNSKCEHIQDFENNFGILNFGFTNNIDNDIIEEKNDWYIWLAIGVGSFLLLLIILIIIIVVVKKKKKKDEMARRKALLINKNTPPNQLRLTSSNANDKTKSLPNKTPPKQNINNPNASKNNPNIPTPRVGTSNAVKPGLVKNGTVPPSPWSTNQATSNRAATPPPPPPIKVNTPPKSFAPKKIDKK